MSAFGSLVTGFGFAGQGLAVLLAVLAVFALPRGERRLARLSFALLLLHVLARAFAWHAPEGAFATRLLRFLATFSLFASIAQSGFLLVVRSTLARRLTRPWPRIVHDLLQAFVFFGVALLALSAVGVEPGSLLTTSALLTAVIGLSLQDTLGNLFAGLALQAQPPFAVGDWIRYAEGPEGVGCVLEINWRATHLVTVTQIEVIVPNAVMAKAPLRNFSRPTPVTRRDSAIVLPAELSPVLARRLLLRALENVPQVLREPAASVLVGDFGERGIEYALRYFIDDYAQRDVVEAEIRQRLWYALCREQITIPAPRRRIELESALMKPDAARDVSAASRAPISRSRGSHAPRPLPQRLADIAFLNGADGAVFERLAEGTRRCLFAPGEVIIRQGDSGDELFVLERGTVEVLAARGCETPARVAELGPGQFFGEAALLRGEQRTASVIAVTECELLIISSRAFRSAAELDPSLESRLAERLASRLVELNKAVSAEDSSEHLDDERRSDVLIHRIKQFFLR